VIHIHKHLGAGDPGHDAVVEEMKQTTKVEKLADAIDEAEANGTYERRPEGGAGNTS